jgi:hypothetical protein
MPDPGMRARVKRLLGGDFRSDDLTRLFLFARDRCDGRESVQEIGDFVAHHDERSKGLITRTTRDWYITAWYYFLNMQRPLDRSRLPANYPEFLQASLRRTEIQILKTKAGVSRADARKLLTSAIHKLVSNGDGTFAMSPLHTKKEVSLLECLGANLSARPAFDGNRLFEDFIMTLKSNGLIERAEIREFQKLYPAVSLFAITVMHNCIIKIDDGSRISLTVSENAAPKGKLEVMAGVPVLLLKIDNAMPFAGAIPIPGRQESVIVLALAMFSTDLDAAEHCTTELLEAPKPWNMALEVTGDIRLGILG